MKIERIISIIMILLERETISASKLAKMLEVSTRTIYRDIDAINAAGVPIVSFPGINGGIGIMSTYKVEKKLFTLSDVTQLMKALSNVPSDLDSTAILNTMVKIKGLVSDENYKQIELQTNQVIIDNNPWVGSREKSESLDQLKHAIENTLVVTFLYRGQNNETSNRKIEPYQLVLKNAIWYLKGFCLEKNDFRIFRLSRIEDLQILDEAFSPRECDYKEIKKPNWNKQNFTEVTLLLDPSMQNWAEQYCHPESIQKMENGKIKAIYPLIENDFGYSMLLRLGDKCECLEPIRVRNALIQHIESVLAIYK